MSPHATGRTPGFDVARALAILGMILVNYRGKMDAAERGPGWLVWISDALEGRSAALFVVLAGVGIALRLKSRQVPKEELWIDVEQRAILKRGVALLVIGLLNLHMWDWDILHFYGVYMFIAALFMRSSNTVLWVGAAAFVALATVLQYNLDYEMQPELWTPLGFTMDMLFNGLHPVFPWTAFVLIGIWLGRIDLRDARKRRWIGSIAALATAASELLDFVSEHWAWGDAAWWASSWPRPPTPTYIVAAAGSAIVLVCLAIEFTERRSEHPAVLALVATGQMSFTIYLAHAVAIVVPKQHGIFVGSTLGVSVGYSLVMFAAFVWTAVWWRRRFEQGPVEALFRQLTGRTKAGPWGGAPLPR